MVIKLKLIYNNKELDLKESKSFFSRFKGFMFKKNINSSLLFDHCNSVHTFFMCENIDIIMCNNDNIILYYYKNVGKNKIILPKRAVKKVYETAANYFKIKDYDKLQVKK